VVETGTGGAALEVGDWFGFYRIDAFLGEGGMGQVFRATRQPDGVVVALKVIRTELTRSSQHARRFLHEARAAGQVQHPHLVGVIDAGEIEGRQYLAMPFVRGGSLAERIAVEGPLPV